MSYTYVSHWFISHDTTSTWKLTDLSFWKLSLSVLMYIEKKNPLENAKKVPKTFKKKFKMCFKFVIGLNADLASVHQIWMTALFTA